MKMNDRLVQYLEQLAGEPIDLKHLTSDQMTGLPTFLASEYVYMEWSWLGQRVVLAQVQGDHDLESVSKLQSTHQTLAGHFKRPVVFVFPALDAYYRNRLVQLGLPFIVPGRQLFVPPFASLSEQFNRVAKSDKLSAAAQATVLFQLHRPQADGSLLNQWAEWLGYSAMTMTKVRDELVAHNLCMREEGAKPRGLRFLHQKRALWDVALPFLRSPVGRTHWVQFQKTPPALPLAGLTALSKLSLLEDDPLPTYACHTNLWKKLKTVTSAQEVGHTEEASARVECWRYAPGLLAEKGTVDRLSLYLSLADSSDERVRLAAKSVLEGMSW